MFSRMQMLQRGKQPNAQLCRSRMGWQRSGDQRQGMIGVDILKMGRLCLKIHRFAPPR